MRVTIDKYYRDMGRRNDPKYCPIAMAMRDRLKKDVSVSDKSITVGDIRIPLPEVARLWIEKFDRGEKVEDLVFSVKSLSTITKEMGERAKPSS